MTTNDKNDNKFQIQKKLSQPANNHNKIKTTKKFQISNNKQQTTNNKQQ